ncbi:hypothetical protein [Acidovorax radicis]|uniref:hypothetical protein n=1 Tax=Acidovorax radicis TaxID=758826 RepID=UPI00111230C1|nr:hypothetical protein [Acidovorax radicis]
MSDGTFCSSCRTPIAIDCDEAGVRLPCPNCGALYRTVQISIVETLHALDGTGMKVKRPRVKKPILEQFDKPSYSHSRKEYVRHVRVIDREEDKYLEMVSPYGSEEAIHHCEEPLSQHVGHGSAKSQKATADQRKVSDFTPQRIDGEGADEGASSEP